MTVRRTWRTAMASDLGILLIFGLLRLVPLLLTTATWAGTATSWTCSTARVPCPGDTWPIPLRPRSSLRVALTLFGPSILGVRLFAALAGAAAMVLAGLMARELGGKRWPR